VAHARARCLQRLADSFGESFGIAGGVDLFTEDDELVARHACEAVAIADQVAEPVGEREEQRVVLERIRHGAGLFAGSGVGDVGGGDIGEGLRCGHVERIERARTGSVEIDGADWNVAVAQRGVPTTARKQTARQQLLRSVLVARVRSTDHFCAGDNRRAETALVP